jgi:hypothetical protein
MALFVDLAIGESLVIDLSGLDLSQKDQTIVVTMESKTGKRVRIQVKADRSIPIKRCSAGQQPLSPNHGSGGSKQGGA